MGLNLSNIQISKELELNKDDVQYMTEYLRNEIHKKKQTINSLDVLSLMKCIL